MSKELVISATRHETKVAILEDDQLVEIYFQRSNEYSLAGSIHKGKVTRVLPGMQSAFVDLGLERDTFLYVSDFFEENEEYDRITTSREERPVRSERIERPERGERPERAERRERPDLIVDAAAAIEVDPVMPELKASPEVIEPAGVTERAVAAPPPERREDRRDDRGRRGRRRRNRGRGFPESKYASDANEPSQTAPVEPQAGTAPHPEEEFPVLPGESLAKYRRSALEPETFERELEEPVLTPVEYHGGELEHMFTGSGAAAAREPEPVHKSEPVNELQPVIEPGNITGHAVELEAAEEPAPEFSEEAEAVSEIIAEEREGGAFDLEDLVDSPQPAIELLQEDLADGVPENDEGSDEESESEMALEPVEGASTSAEPVAASHATGVREHGGRYLHRVSRRNRRKMRAGSGSAPTEAGVAPAQVERTDERRGAPDHRSGPRPERSATPSITELLKEGQEIIVQIAKEPLGQKGARITSHIALPGRYVVYMPTLEHMGVSRKIASDEERLRLKKILQAHRPGIQGGFIVRTAGEGKSEDEIIADMNFLGNLWLDIRSKAEKRPAPVLLHHDLDIVQRILRDQVSDSFKSIWVDSEEAYESILRFVQRFQPAMVARVKLYTRSAPIFDAFNITPELEKALRPKIWLKSGGYIVINQTEALVAIDVNTGKYVGKSNRLEDTIVKTNTEAVKEIVRQIRLRDLGGIIVVDFIDMDERKNRQKVMQALEEAMRADKAPNKILQFNDFGLVAITRKRVKQSLERALCSPCPYCDGAGSVKSVQTTVGDILQEAHKILKAVEGENVILRVHPEVAKFLKSNQNKYLEELEEILRRPVLVKGDPLLHQEKFDLA